jgi:NAD(P)H-dependent FMN reductase
MFRIAVLYGSTRREREGIKAARFVVRELQARGHEVTLLDAMELDLPMLDLMFKEYEEGTAPASMQRAHDALEAADAFVVVGGEYNHSVPPALKNMLDHFQSEFFYKPAGICTYSAGPFGGVRAAVHYRAILGELGMVTTSIMFAVSRVQAAFDEEGNDLKGDYARRVGRFLNELEWYADALAAKRATCAKPMEPCGTRLFEQVA